jgi:hypothetical protein
MEKLRTILIAGRRGHVKTWGGGFGILVGFLVVRWLGWEAMASSELKATIGILVILAASFAAGHIVGLLTFSRVPSRGYGDWIYTLAGTGFCVGLYYFIRFIQIAKHNDGANIFAYIRVAFVATIASFFVSFRFRTPTSQLMRPRH